jgi:hypothetical protein
MQDMKGQKFPLGPFFPHVQPEQLLAIINDQFKDNQFSRIKVLCTDNYSISLEHRLFME